MIVFGETIALNYAPGVLQNKRACCVPNSAGPEIDEGIDSASGKVAQRKCGCSPTNPFAATLENPLPFFIVPANTFHPGTETKDHKGLSQTGCPGHGNPSPIET
jgi:hypothetical protein